MNDGGPAFPVVIETRTDYGIGNTTGVTTQKHLGGMSLRDYFASMALQGFISSNATFVNVTNPTEEHYAIASYSVSDFMLREREKQK